MPRKPTLKSRLKTADDICTILTGKRINHIVAAAIDTFGDEVLNRTPQGPIEDSGELTRRMNYLVLGISPDAPDFLVKAAWKAQLKECHPDTNKPDEEKAKRINCAYEAVCKERGISK